MTLRDVNRFARRLGAAPAAPAGGAHPRGRGRGCGIIIGLALLAAPLNAQTLTAVPSQQPLTLSEVLIDDAPGEIWLRFRFLAPQIARDGGSIDSTAASADMEYICNSFALPYMSSQNLAAARIVISMMDREVAFGETDPDATQFFEVYRPEEGRCIWEAF